MIRVTRPPCPNPVALRNGNYKHSDNKRELCDANHDKCMYCESKVSHIDYGDVEHIRPKAIFPEQEFEWNNLGFACGRCNNEKGSKYFAEQPFVDPYVDDPDAHVFFCGPLLFPRNGSERGENTVRELALNRPQLIEQRGERLRDLSRALSAVYRIADLETRTAALNELRNEYGSDKEFSAAVRILFQTHGDAAVP